MTRVQNKLSSMAVKAMSPPGRYGDGGGLWLQVGPTGGKSWLFRFAMNGRARQMGVGAVDDVPLAEARQKAAECRRMVRDGLDPIDEREKEKNRRALEAATALTFKDCAEKYIEAHRPGWTNAKHAAQWSSTLATYVYPVFGHLPVASADTRLVLKALEPIWTEKPETASRVRGRIEAILDYAKARGYRTGENPALWKGHVKNLLPARSKIRAVQHHPALPYDEMGAFMATLRAREGLAARGLEFTILTAGRTGEVIGARWEEIDLDKTVWTVPAARMKSKRPHRVALSKAAIALLDALPKVDGSSYVFPGTRLQQPLSNMAFLQLLKRMRRDDLTTHGFRSAFRDWAAERTAYPREVAEMALAHVVSDKVERAYRRGDMFEKRRRLMEEWATFCSAPAAGEQAAIVELRSAL